MTARAREAGGAVAGCPQQRGSRTGWEPASLILAQPGNGRKGWGEGWRLGVVFWHFRLNVIPSTCKLANLQVHPHACGENEHGSLGFADGVRSTSTRVGKTNTDLSDLRMGSGPPPRVWGKRTRTQRRRGRGAVHLHACGENPTCHLPTCQPARSTPTRVGKTYPPSDRVRCYTFTTMM